MIGTLYSLRYDVKRTKKRNAILLSITFSILLVGISFLFYQGEKSTVITITENRIQLDGMYDDTIAIKDIEEMKWMSTLPTDTIKSNGFATETRSLGSFRSKEFGAGRHYVFKKHPPYIFIKTNEKYFIINSKDKQETKQWYKGIEKAVNTQK